ncbi:Ig-like domain-containing protein [Streptomyces sp. SudanB25_2051]|uniref:Ig-like domain-containing protein n=1 Tax=Streptomyces sp. SudanB25_2051 TaxID=3035275 RepID=UPI003F559EF7
MTVTAADGGRLTGRSAAGGTRWTSDRKAVPGAAYTVKVVSRGTDGKEATTRSAFTTEKADRVNRLTLAPGKNATVGIGQPLSIVFDRPVKRKADVERQLKVTTSNGTEGSWGWVTDHSGRDRADWRPRAYWKPGTKVTLEADLNGTDSGDGWFVRDYRTGFTVGASQVVRVDLDAKRLSLVKDGRTVRTIPVSGGTPGGDKRSWRGTAVLMAKEGTIRRCAVRRQRLVPHVGRAVARCRALRQSGVDRSELADHQPKSLPTMAPGFHRGRAPSGAPHPQSRHDLVPGLSRLRVAAALATCLHLEPASPIARLALAMSALTLLGPRRLPGERQTVQL